jgi:leucyl aminopeptidase
MLEVTLGKQIHKSHALVFIIDKTTNLTQVLKSYKLDKLISQLDLSNYKAEKLEKLVLLGESGKIERVIFVSIGDKTADIDTIRQAGGIAAKMIKGLKQEGGHLAVKANIKDHNESQIIRALTEGAILSLYSYDTFKTDDGKEIKDKSKVHHLAILANDTPENHKAIARATKLSNAVFLTRQMVNLPGNKMTPSEMAKTAKALAKDNPKIKVTVLGEEQIAKLGMGSYLGVGKGSAQECQFIVLEYYGESPKVKPVVFVGKSVTFDTGGISLKPASDMDKMRYDMAGGAAAMGIMKAVSDMELPVNLVCIMAAVENMPSGTAIKPGDILTSMAGITINVLNTDAEGRLTLADALTYAGKFNPKVVIDMATLTGACGVALGGYAAGLFSHEAKSKKLKDELKISAKYTGEGLWDLPLDDYHLEQIKDDFADIKNAVGPQGGASTAAAFLYRFAKDYDWAHIDIAGMAWADKEMPYTPKGGAGYGVRLIVNYIENQIKEEAPKKAVKAKPKAKK